MKNASLEYKLIILLQIWVHQLTVLINEI